MARLLLRALESAGFAPHLATGLRTLDKIGDISAQNDLRRMSQIEAGRLTASYQARPSPERPRLWFTYHVYYKAPDWIGPLVSRSLGIPYVIAEGSRAAKRANGPWAIGHRGAESALDQADVIFVMTDHDREALQRAKPASQTLVDFPPFIDLDEWGHLDREPDSLARASTGAPRLLTVAMMRAGDKLASYEILAAALKHVQDRAWTLDIVGSGEARPVIERLFAPLGGRVHFHGELDDRVRLRRLYAEADLFVWPAVNEAYGMALLEAQAFGCPVVAGAYGGVPSVIRDQETGRLSSPGDARAFAEAVAALLDDPVTRHSMGARARRFVLAERGLDHAAQRLRNALMPLLDQVRP